MTAATLTLPRPHLYPRLVAKEVDVQRGAENYADEHGVHVVAESYTDHSVRLVPFPDATQAAYYSERLATTDQRKVARKDRLPVLVAVAAPEPVPTVGAEARLHAHEETVAAVVTNVTAKGVSVRVGDSKAKSYRRAGRNRYTSGSTVVTLV